MRIGKEMESLEYAYIIGSNANCTNTFETGLKYLVKQIFSHLNLAVPFLGIGKNEMHTILHQKTCIKKIIAAIFKRAIAW